MTDVPIVAKGFAHSRSPGNTTDGPTDGTATVWLNCTRLLQAFARPRFAGVHTQGSSQPRLVKPHLQHSYFTAYQGRSPGNKSPIVADRAQHHVGTGRSAGQSVQPPPKPEKVKDAFCRKCGTKMELAIPKGEAAWRHMCSSCGYIDYLNPKMVWEQCCSRCAFVDVRLALQNV